MTVMGIDILADVHRSFPGCEACSHPGACGRKKKAVATIDRNVSPKAGHRIGITPDVGHCNDESTST
jgi:hypothetical protein